MEKGFKKWYNKYVRQKETAGAVSFFASLPRGNQCHGLPMPVGKPRIARLLRKQCSISFDIAHNMYYNCNARRRMQWIPI